MEHPDYDEFWKKEAWVNQLHALTVPNLNVAGFWDQEDPWGPWQIFRHAARERSAITPTSWSPVPGITASGRHRRADSIGLIGFGGHETAREFREKIEAPFFRYYLHGKGEKPAWQATTFQTGSNTLATYDAWPPAGSQSRRICICTPTARCPSMRPTTGKPYREYVSDPANPVPYRQRPISPTYPDGDWRTWEVADQRFVDHRPDVLTLRQRAARSRSHGHRRARGRLFRLDLRD